MINIATVHWKSSFFQEIQYEYIKNNLGEDSRIWAYLDKIPEQDFQNDKRYYFHEDSNQTDHLFKLDSLANLICDKSKDDDIIIFIDGDAWPISPMQQFITSGLKEKKLGAVLRSENGERYPHPCFLFTTVGFWKDARLSWSKFEINHILHVLNSMKLDWIKLNRTGGLTDHLIFFSIYGDMIYHHGAGFRIPVSAYCKSSGMVIEKEFSLKMLDVFKEWRKHEDNTVFNDKKRI